eukprot:scaffold283118_cov32-Tisochrysis_lutea.AAC.3
MAAVRICLEWPCRSRPLALLNCRCEARWVNANEMEAVLGETDLLKRRCSTTVAHPMDGSQWNTHVLKEKEHKCTQ